MLRRILSDERGVAVMEFAIVLPVLLVLFFGSYVISDMISCYRKVTATTRALTDLASRGISPSSPPAASTVSTYMSSASLVMSPFDTTVTNLQISLLRICDASHAYVVWSKAQTGTTTATSSLAEKSVVSVPAGVISSTMVPTSPDGSNVCSNTAAASNKTVVGTAGSYLFLGQIAYTYQPAISLGRVATTNMADQIYMSPRLN